MSEPTKILDRWTDTETTSDECHYRLVRVETESAPELQICLYGGEGETDLGEPAHPDHPGASWERADEPDDDGEALRRRVADLADRPALTQAREEGRREGLREALGIMEECRGRARTHYRGNDPVPFWMQRTEERVARLLEEEGHE